MSGDNWDVTRFAAAGLESSFTMTVAELIALGYDTPKKLGLDSYPLYDETHRAELNYKIIQHYAYREIAAETPEQFVYYMRRTMQEIMPLYNQRYESAAASVDFMSTVDVTTDTSSDTSNTTTAQSSGKTSADQQATATTVSDSKSSADTSARSVDSDTPQTQLSGYENYATHLNDTTSHNDTVSHSTQDTSSDSHTQTEEQFTHNRADGSGHAQASSRTHGRQGDAARLLDEWRKVMVNIDMEIVYALEPCFLQVWDSGDTMGGAFAWRTPYTGTNGVEW